MRLVCLFAFIALVGCVSDQELLTHDQMHNALISKRGSDAVCLTRSDECINWTQIAFQCMQNEESERSIPFTTGVGVTCDRMNEVQMEATRGKGGYDF